jgi:hypothetical protein
MPTVDQPTSTTTPKSELTRELLPPKDNKDVGYEIFRLLEKVVKYKNDLGLPGKWNRNYELGKNKHWKQESDKVTLITANLLFAHRQRTVNTLTDNNPTFNVKQVGEVEPDKEVVFESLLHTSEFWWQEQEQQSVLEESIMNGETYGCTIEKGRFDADIEYGIGECVTDVVDPYYFGWYPVKTRKIQKAEAVFHYEPMSVREARRRYPDVAEHIVADKQLLDELGDERIEASANARSKRRGYFSAFSGVIKNVLNIAGEGRDDEDEVLMVECWVKDYTRKSENGKEFDLYPGNIRCVTTCNGGKVVCNDRANPSINPMLDLEQASKTYLFDKYPFSLTHSVTDTANPWGMTDYEQLEGLQIELDKTLSQLTLIKDKLSRLKIKNPQDSGVDNSEFTNAPGIINPANAMVSEAIKYMDLPNVPFADLNAALGVYKDFFFLVAGSFELEQAQTPGREVIAYKAIATLLERAATMMRGKIRNYSKLIRERGRMYISNVMNWYDTERWISYEMDGEEMNEAINGHEMIIPAKLNVVSGSTLPRSQVQEREEALGLHERGAIDTEELLKKIDWPKWKQVVKRLQLGPLSDLFEKLEKMGFPPTLIDAFAELQQMEMKDFDKELEKGQIPTAAELLTPPEEGEQIPATEQADIEKTEAETVKVRAEVELTMEKINTEKVEQAVKMAGVEFDKEKLSTERARMIKEIGISEKELELKEKDIDVSLEVAKSKGGNGDATKSAKKREQGPNIEKGLQSNNQGE